MPGAIAGALAAVLGAKNRLYRTLADDFKKDVVAAVKADLFNIIDAHLKDLESDLVSAMNIEKRDDEIQDMMMIRFKKQTANRMVAKTRAAILQVLTH